MRSIAPMSAWGRRSLGRVSSRSFGRNWESRIPITNQWLSRDLANPALGDRVYHTRFGDKTEHRAKQGVHAKARVLRRLPWTLGWDYGGFSSTAPE